MLKPSSIQGKEFMTLSNMVPNIPFTALKQFNAEQVRNMQSCEITSDGEYLFTLIVVPKNAGMTIGDNIKTNAEYLAVRSNTVGGIDPKEYIKEKSHAAV